jgi:adenylate cyclase
MEIERKFLLRQPPPREALGAGTHIDQGYLPLGLRLRRMGARHCITLKGAGTLARDEWETELPEWAFAQLWPATEGCRLTKTRYAVPHGSFTLEVDEYHGSLGGLWTLECEFARVEEAGTLVLPAWAGTAVDVTTDPAYRNASLARFGVPTRTG